MQRTLSSSLEELVGTSDIQYRRAAGTSTWITTNLHLPPYLYKWTKEGGLIVMQKGNYLRGFLVTIIDIFDYRLKLLKNITVQFCEVDIPYLFEQLPLITPPISEDTSNIDVIKSQINSKFLFEYGRFPTRGDKSEYRYKFNYPRFRKIKQVYRYRFFDNGKRILTTEYGPRVNYYPDKFIRCDFVKTFKDFAEIYTANFVNNRTNLVYFKRDIFGPELPYKQLTKVNKKEIDEIIIILKGHLAIETL